MLGFILFFEKGGFYVRNAFFDYFGRFKSAGKFVIAKIRYSDCINYEGNKILVFENASKKEVLSAKEIDPHFCESNHLSPIARFEPTKNGWQNAIVFCKNA